VVSKYEQETVISRAGDEDVWHVWSTDQRVLGQLTRLAQRLSIKVSTGNDGGPWVELGVPGDRVRLFDILSERKKPEGRQREALLARLQAARERRRWKKQVEAGTGNAAAAERQNEGRDGNALLPMGENLQ
jgi:hypothetical protein